MLIYLFFLIGQRATMQFITAYSYIVQNIEIFYVNSIGGVIISMLTSSVVDRGFEPLSGQTKNKKNGICWFSARHAILRRKSKYITIWHYINYKTANTRDLFLWDLRGKGSTNIPDVVSLTRLKTKAIIEIVCTSSWQWPRFNQIGK